MKAKINYKKRLAVLWALLNASTEYSHPTSDVIAVMDSIERDYPEVRGIQRKSRIVITIDGEVISDFRGNRWEVDL